MHLRFDKNGSRKRLRSASIVMILVLLLFTGCHRATMAPRETSAGPDDKGVTWYYFDWMAEAPYAPVFHVLDTQSSLGPYARNTKAITLKDLVKMHGHPCDGLVTAACALSLGFKTLYPEGLVDRTDTGCITNNSPCYGDVATYLTGGRIRFGTQKIDPGMGAEFILYRFSTGKAVKVTLRPGVFPREVRELEGRIRSGHFTLEEMRRCQRLEWAYARKILSRPPEDWFSVQVLVNFSWAPDAYQFLGKRGDVINKNALKQGMSGH